MMKKITLLVVAIFVGITTFAQTTVTHNASQAIEAGEGLTCSSGIVTDNNFYGAFDLSTDFAITYDFVIQEFEFGLETLANAPGDVFPVTVSFYTTDNGLPTGTLTQIGTTTFTTVSSTDGGTVVIVDVNAAGAIVPVGEVLVAEVAILADGVTDFRFGANLGGATDDSWLMAADCGATVPTRYQDLGAFPQHHIMNVTGGDTAGIADSVINGFNMYPNPVNDVLNLKADVNIDTVSIYNMLGQKVLTSSQTQIDMSALPTGSYIVKVQAGEQVASYNLVKR